MLPNIYNNVFEIKIIIAINKTNKNRVKTIVDDNKRVIETIGIWILKILHNYYLI